MSPKRCENRFFEFQISILRHQRGVRIAFEFQNLKCEQRCVRFLSAWSPLWPAKNLDVVKLAFWVRKRLNFASHRCVLVFAVIGIISLSLRISFLELAKRRKCRGPSSWKMPSRLQRGLCVRTTVCHQKKNRSHNFTTQCALSTHVRINQTLVASQNNVVSVQNCSNASHYNVRQMRQNETKWSRRNIFSRSARSTEREAIFHALLETLLQFETNYCSSCILEC
jgi:hypothetical protein